MKKISVDVSKRVLAGAAMALTTALVFLGGASSVALAAPKGVFSVFEQCPTGIPGVALCQYAELTGGEFAIGPMRVPIDKTIVLQGGAIHTGGIEFNEYFVIPAVNGESLSKTELDIPGGLSALIDCETIKGRGFGRALQRHACRRLIRHRRNDASVIVEPAAGLSNPAIENLAHFALEKNTALTFPVKLHFKNPLLGEACDIGSDASPIELRLTTGTTAPPLPNEPIKGAVGDLSEEEQEEQVLTVAHNDILVDNSFTAPVAEGCGASPYLSSFVDGLIDQTLDLESPSGHNTAILEGTHRIAETAAVLASETFPEITPPTPPHHHHHHWWPAR